MDKIDREDSAEPTSDTAVEARNADDDVTAVVMHEIDAAAGDRSSANEDPTAGAAATDRAGLPGRPAQTGLPDDDALEPGFILRDRFEIVELIHSGGMGRVYKALDNRRHRSASEQVHVAIKMMRRSLAPGFDARRALEREAARTQQLSHPNIVNIFDFDQHDDQFFIVMEWLDGESLNALLRRTTGRPIATPFAWRIIEGVASGLQHAHAKNVVHADINPSNIFLTDTQDVKLLDFGVARYASQVANEADDEPLWTTHTYASPDVLSGKPPGVEDDIFSLACVAYRALTGKHPFAGRTSKEAMQQQLDIEPIPGLAEHYWRVLKQSLAYERSDRPASASVFLVDPSEAASPTRPEPRRFLRYGLPSLIVAAVALGAGYLWQSQDGRSGADTAAADSTPPVEPAVTDESIAPETTAADPEAVAQPSPLGVLLDDARLAMAESRYVEPAEDNARTLYRAALALDPTNADAVAGLREIGNVYVHQAEAALRDGDLDGVLAAYVVAKETDADNPALAILGELLMAQANGAVANAQVAVAEGDIAGASEWLAQAERYALIDADTISAVRNRIEGAQAERALLDAVTIAEANIAAGKLIAPAGDNAHEQLLELQQNYGSEPQVATAIERLVERLLNRAAFATAAEQFTVAEELLAAASVFNVLELDVAAAQQWLQQASELAAAPAPTGSLSTGSLEPDDQLADDISPETAAGSDDAGLIASTPNEDDAEAVQGGADPATEVAPPEAEQQKAVPLSELDIENFVPPRYPPRASEAGLSGFVDLRFSVNPDGSTGNIEIVNAAPGDTFIPSAINAVRQWRFAEREDSVRALVRLRFDPQAIE